MATLFFEVLGICAIFHHRRRLHQRRPQKRARNELEVGPNSCKQGILKKYKIQMKPKFLQPSFAFNF